MNVFFHCLMNGRQVSQSYSIFSCPSPSPQEQWLCSLLLSQFFFLVDSSLILIDEFFALCIATTSRRATGGRCSCVRCACGSCSTAATSSRSRATAACVSSGGARECSTRRGGSTARSARSSRSSRVRPPQQRRQRRTTRPNAMASSSSSGRTRLRLPRPTCSRLPPCLRLRPRCSQCRCPRLCRSALAALQPRPSRRPPRRDSPEQAILPGALVARLIVSGPSILQLTLRYSSDSVSFLLWFIVMYFSSCSL